MGGSPTIRAGSHNSFISLFVFRLFCWVFFRHSCAVEYLSLKTLQASSSGSAMTRALETKDDAVARQHSRRIMPVKPFAHILRCFRLSLTFQTQYGPF